MVDLGWVPGEKVVRFGKGGKVQMALGKTFWSPRYGMVKDRFGVHWMVMVPGQQP